MRTILISLVLWCCNASAQLLFPEESLLLVPYGAVAPYLMDENFESGTAPLGWTAASGSIVYNQTGISGMGGNNCLKVVSSGSAVDVTTASFAAMTEVWFYCLVQISSDSTCNMIELENAAGTRAALFYLPGGGSGPRIYEGNVNGNCGAALSTSQTYHCWIHWKNDHSADIGFSTDGVRPTSGTLYATTSSGDSTATDVTKVRLRADASQTCYFDNVRVKTSQIGDNGI